MAAVMDSVVLTLTTRIRMVDIQTFVLIDGKDAEIG